VVDILTLVTLVAHCLDSALLGGKDRSHRFRVEFASTLGLRRIHLSGEVFEGLCGIEGLRDFLHLLGSVGSETGLLKLD